MKIIEFAAEYLYFRPALNKTIEAVKIEISEIRDPSIVP